MADVTRRLIILGSGAIALSGIASCSTVADLGLTDSDAGNETGAALPIVNNLRQDHGLNALHQDKAAVRAAIDHASRMARHGEMQHNIGIGANFLKRMKGMAVKLPAAENIATGQQTVERAVDAWINSPKHLKNMLADYRGLGVAVAQNSASQNRPYWAMVLSG